MKRRNSSQFLLKRTLNYKKNGTEHLIFFYEVLMIILELANGITIGIKNNLADIIAVTMQLDLAGISYNWRF